MIKGFGKLLSLTIPLLILFPILNIAMAGTDQTDPLPQTFGLKLDATAGSVQSHIDSLSNQLSKDPYRSDLYYQLSRAYSGQGWHDKAAQYMSQWMKIGNDGISLNGPNAYVLDEENDRILVIDKASRQVIKRIDVGWSPRKLIPTADGSQFFVPNALANNVSVVDTGELVVTDTIKSGRMPWNGVASPSDGRVYVTNLRSDNVSVIDVKTNEVLKSVSVDRGPWGVAVSPDGHRLYVSNQNSQNIQVIDTGSYSVVDVISIGTHPRDIALAPDDKNKLYAVDGDIVSDEVEIYVVDLDSSSVVGRMDVPATDDPLLARFEELSLEEKLALLSIPESDKKAKEDVPAKPEHTEIPALTNIPEPAKGPVRPVTERDKGTREADMPMGGPVALSATEPLIHAYIKVPAAASGKPLPLAEYQQIDTKKTEKKPSTSEPKPQREERPVEEKVAVKQEKRILRIIVVVRNDTLWKISLDNYGEASNKIYETIQGVNPEIKNPDKIYEGQKIKLPTLNTYKVYEGKSVKVEQDDTLFGIVLRNYTKVNDRVYAEIKKANPSIKDISLIHTGQRIALPDIPSIPFRDHA